ncbi:hypothetical protein NBH00_04065 [Paraconexibacter antarcticus]|uniref:Uncharacterized protein n=1 Tax=Paraconexibacter antarcticus TaxID=2949664 RepID=A0ABY5DWE3_9ACTN|nr:hypothetical protein [Paraconexibacter antarcticus]UTI65392.1 hypothetical protein NBH00_04065 [Paraconexibacter antarcticus]
MPSAHCPHCLLVIADEGGDRFPPVLMRCPHCRLTVAPGRARFDVGDHTGSSGSAAGLLVNAARRTDGEVTSPEAIEVAVRHAAETLEVPVGRLRMIDYQRVANGDDTMPGLASILDTHGSWKRARRAVATGEAAPAEDAAALADAR